MQVQVLPQLQAAANTEEKKTLLRTQNKQTNAQRLYKPETSNSKPPYLKVIVSSFGFIS